MKKMRSKIRRYIYISTDSVYEVCKEPSHEGPTFEEDAVRPEDPKEREAYAERDPYGSNKLDCKYHFGGIPLLWPRFFLDFEQSLFPLMDSRGKKTSEWARTDLVLRTFSLFPPLQI